MEDAVGNLHDILALAGERAERFGLPYAGALTPPEAFLVWQTAPGAVLVDCRTRAEWDWVGRIPGAVEIEWLHYPDLMPNPDFLTHLRAQVDPESLVMFLCRSGGRSDQAARVATAAGFTSCYNVLEGFEGAKDAAGHRGTVGGWKFHGLPWVQS
jgi:rhodanese-related sulfurtransferase|nr:rhodanese-like domain-containing protein [Tepidiphilus sp. J10]